MTQPVPSWVSIWRQARIANHIGLIRFIWMANWWNNTVRS